MAFDLKKLEAAVAFQRRPGQRSRYVAETEAEIAKPDCLTPGEASAGAIPEQQRGAYRRRCTEVTGKLTIKGTREPSSCR